jgi:putative DNA primase/helicase
MTMDDLEGIAPALQAAIDAAEDAPAAGAGEEWSIGSDVTEAAEQVDRGFADAGVRVMFDDPHRLAGLYLAANCRHPDRPTLVHQGGEFLRWEDGRYREEPDVSTALVRTIRAEFERINRLAVASWTPPEDGSPGRPPTVRKVDTKLILNTKQALTSLVALPTTLGRPAWLDGEGFAPAGEVVPFPNGLVHLERFLAGGDDHRVAPTPRYFSTRCLPYNFDPMAPQPAQWLDFLDSVWGHEPAAIRTLQEWFGYLLTGDTGQQKILMIVGPTRSGKGTIGRVVQALLGPEDSVGSGFTTLATQFGLAPLVDRGLAVLADARLSGKTDMAAIVERLLSISGEDAITVDRKHRAPWTGTLATRLMLLTNELPTLRDASMALANRLIVLEMTESFLGRGDPALMGKLRPELPGILLWALEGRRRLHKLGKFRMPESGRAVVDELKDLASPVGQFVAECCEVAPGCFIPKDALHGRYKVWNQEQGNEYTLSKVHFGRQLRAAAPWVKAGERTVAGPFGEKESRASYIGIALRHDAASTHPKGTMIDVT